MTNAGDIDRLVTDICATVPEGAKVVFVSGDFNVIHPGHQRILNFAAGCGDFLVVGVNGDGLGNTLIPEQLRCEGVAALSVVNHTFVLPVPAAEFIGRLKPAIVVKGAEHRKRANVEQTVVDSYGGKLLFGSGETMYSSLDLLRHEFQITDFSSIRLPTDYPQRHGFSVKGLIDVVKRFSELRVVVIGDLIVDEYIDCDPLGMSREDPTIVVTPIMSKRFLGGAGIIAGHAKGLGANVTYFGVAADDAAAAFARQTMEAYGIDHHLLCEESRPTTLKQRFRAANKTLLRVSHLRQHDIGDDVIDAMARRVEGVAETADLVIFSDFNYGCLPQALVDRISAFCQKCGIPTVADSQASSQIGDVSRFRDAMLLTPTEHEARLALRDSRSGLVVLADSLARKANAQYVIVTLGAEGILVHTPGEHHGLITDRLPAFNSAPKDVSGAGDCLLTCTAMAMRVGADIWQSAYLGSIAAACQVSRIGNTPLTVDELVKELQT